MDQQVLANIPEGISVLKLQLSSQTVKTTSSAIHDTEEHTQALFTEASRIESTVKNPLQRYAFEKGSEEAIRKIDESLSAAKIGRADSAPKPQARTRHIIEGNEAFMDHFFGSIYIKSKTRRLRPKVTDSETLLSQNDQYEHESSFSVCPAPWLVSLGFKYGLHLRLLKSSIQGWQQALKPFCPVRNDSLIFEFCAQGNIDGVRSLLSRGDASVRDTDSNGRTALHVSIETFGSTLASQALFAAM